MPLDSKNHVLLSRPLIDQAKRMIYRQYGRMRTEIFPMADQKKYKQVVITWFKSAYKAEIVGNSNVEYYRFWQGKHGQLGSYDRHLFFDPNPFEIQNWVGNYYKLVSPQAEYICPFIRCSLPDHKEGGEKENEDQPAVPDHDKEGARRKKTKIRLRIAKYLKTVQNILNSFQLGKEVPKRIQKLQPKMNKA